MGRRTCAWILLGCLCGAPACGGGDGPACEDPDTVIRFPADEAPHAMDMEWWYYTGHLWTGTGERYGFELSFFQTFAGEQVGYAAHVAMSDPVAREHAYDQTLSAPDEIFPRFDLRVGDWTMRGDGTRDHLTASLAGYAFDLTCTRTKPVAYHADGGIIEMGGGMTSFYYSKTRLEVEGTLTAGDTTGPVTGMAWMDHQWGDFDVFGSDGWDWFSMQFEDETEIMVFLLHFKEGGTRQTGGTFVDPDGCHRHFDEVQVEARDSWTSPHTGATYPLGWSVTIPSLPATIEVTPTFEDQEMDSRATTLNVYWEGEVTVAGTRAGEPVSGLGYVELAGYGPWGP
jgi:predicted secreted hydrolase